MFDCFAFDKANDVNGLALARLLQVGAMPPKPYRHLVFLGDEVLYFNSQVPVTAPGGGLAQRAVVSPEEDPLYSLLLLLETLDAYYWTLHPHPVPSREGDPLLPPLPLRERSLIRLGESKGEG
jgi:hypothetical protein